MWSDHLGAFRIPSVQSPNVATDLNALLLSRHRWLIRRHAHKLQQRSVFHVGFTKRDGTIYTEGGVIHNPHLLNCASLTMPFISYDFGAACRSRGCCYEELPPGIESPRPNCFWKGAATPIKIAHLIQSNHFDAGYTDELAAVINRYEIVLSSQRQ